MLGNPIAAAQGDDDKLWQEVSQQAWDGLPPDPHRDGWHLLRHCLDHPGCVRGTFWQASTQQWWWPVMSATPEATRSSYFYVTSMPTEWRV